MNSKNGKHLLLLQKLINKDLTCNVNNNRIKKTNGNVKKDNYF